MYPLGTRRIDVDFHRRRRPGHFRDLAGQQLEADIGKRLPRASGAIEVGPHRGLNRREDAAQHAVFVQARHFVQRQLELFGDARGTPHLDTPGIETVVEQAQQQPGDARVAHQGLGHVLEAEQGTGLAQIAAVGAQHGDLAPGQAPRQHQLVERIVLRAAVPDRAESILEQLPYRLQIQLAAGLWITQSEVMDPALAVTVGEAQLVGALLQHFDTQILQHRQGSAEGDGAAAVIEPQAQAVGGRFQRTVEHQRQGLPAFEALGPFDIVHRRPHQGVLPVGGAEAVAVTGVEAIAARFAAVLAQRVMEVIRPVSHRACQAQFQGALVHLRNPPLRHAHREMHPRQGGLRQIDRELALVAGIGLLERLLHAPADCGVVTLARDIDQTGDEALEGIRAHEQAHRLAVAQMQDPQGDAIQGIGVDLEQLLTGIAVEDVHQRPVVVAGRRQAGALQHRMDLPAQHRHGARITVIHGRTVEAQDAVLADHPAVGGEAPHADIIHGGGAMDSRALIGLGKDQRLRTPRPGADRLGQRAKALRGTASAVPAQDAQPGVGHFVQRGLALGSGRHEFVGAIAEQRKVVVEQPAQKRLSLVAVGRRQGRGAQLVDHRIDPGPHCRPVADHLAHLAEHPEHLVLDLGQRAGILLAIDLEMQAGIRGVPAIGDRRHLSVAITGHAQRRMHDEVDGEPQPVAGHGQRIHQKGHVIGDDLDDAVQRMPAVLLRVGVVRTDPGFTARPVPEQAPVRKRSAVEIGGAALDQILGGDMTVVVLDKGLHQGPLVARPALGDQLGDLPQ